MNQEEIKSFIKEIGDLPTLPTLYLSLRDKLYDPRSSANDLARILSSDQSICSNILRIANSSFYGLSGRIVTIPHAIVVIGFNGIHHIVLSMTAARMFTEESSCSGFSLITFWEHSLAVATIAKIIGKKLSGISQEEIFTAGLLHDIGKVIIFKYLPEKFREVIVSVKKDKVLIRQAEENLFGFDHTEFGTVLLREWKFPEMLLATTAFHHNPVLAKEYFKSASVVHLADILARSLEIGSGGDEMIPDLSEEAWSALGLELETIDEIIDEVTPELEKSRVFTDLIQ